jgi:glycosyltransferase involved in cell wall biosynthesis
MKFIIIDDGSTNNSYKIAKTYQKKYNWISVYRHANNSGLCYTINKLICLCKSHYFVLLDVDDWYYPFAIEQLIRCSENGECDVVVGKTKYLYKAHFKKWPFSLRNNVF